MVALVIIYNHRYDKNIARLEELYKGRFSNIFHLMPFYDGDKENVIPVYENSYYFQGYIAQAYKTIREAGDFDHFMFIGDDLLPNPEINENNYKEHLRLTDEDSFFPKFEEISNSVKWLRSRKALKFSVDQAGLEIANELPERDAILSQFQKHGIAEPYICRPKGIKAFLHYLKYRIKTNQFWQGGKTKIKHPIIIGYSDMSVIDKYSIAKFVHYCGVFSAGRLFVEVALPTAMLMACKSIKTEEDIEKKGLILWRDDRIAFEEKYNKSLADLYSNFPKDVLFVHPVKLSAWK